MTTSQVDVEATAFLAMAQSLLDALDERERFVRPYWQRYEQVRDDARNGSWDRVRVAEEFVRAAYRADHVYGERVAEGLEHYRRLTSGELRSRY